MNRIEYIINRLPKEIKDLDNIENRISKMNSAITINDVYKISINGSLDKEGFEEAYLFLFVGAGIKEHMHTVDTESYTLVFGDFKMNNELMFYNFCDVNDVHCIDPVGEDTLIKIYKEVYKEDENEL